VRGFLRPSDAMSWMRSTIPYKYDERIPVASLAAAMARPGPYGPTRWAACAEAAAVVAAVAERRHLPWDWCIELSSNYAHVVCYVMGYPYDVYQEQARAIDGCSFTVRGLQ
jgi:hypothetical protein